MKVENKHIARIALVGLGAVLSYYAYDLFKSEKLPEIKSNLSRTPEDFIKTEAEAKDAANRIERGFKNKSFSMVYLAFLDYVNNDNDLLKISKAYGTRKIPSGYFFIPDFEGNFLETIYKKLDKDNIKYLNSILEPTYVKLRF